MSPRILIFAITLINAYPLHAQYNAVSVHFNFTFNSQRLEPGKTYVTASGDSVEFDDIRFYLADPYAINDGKKVPNTGPDRFWLIDWRDSTSWTIKFPISATEKITGIGFWVGIDSLNQIQGARVGPLDPLKGMYWTWNSGYVAVKIEARSPGARTPGHRVEYHLGGYRWPYSVRTSKVYSFGVFYSTTPDQFLLQNPLQLDLSQFFPAEFSIRNTPTLMTPGSAAVQLMNQFSNIFIPLLFGRFNP